MNGFKQQFHEASSFELATRISLKSLNFEIIRKHPVMEYRAFSDKEIDDILALENKLSSKSLMLRNLEEDNQKR